MSVTSVLRTYGVSASTEFAQPDPRLQALGARDPRREGGQSTARDPGDAELPQQRLLQRMLAVLDPQALESGGVGIGVAGGADLQVAAAGDDSDPAERRDPDPQLESAILRFMHSLFRELAAADVAAGGQDAFPEMDASQFALASLSATQGAYGGQSALGSQLEQLAERYAEAEGAGAVTLLDDGLAAGGTNSAANGLQSTGFSAADTGASGSTNPGRVASRSAVDTVNKANSAGSLNGPGLEAAFAEVMQAIHGQPDGPVGFNTRTELVAVLQRLSLALQAPRVLPSTWPTRGALLSASA